MATDIIFHRFWVDLDSILGCFLVLKSEKMDTKKHSKNIPAKKSCEEPEKSGTASCGPLKQFKDPRSQDWQPNQGIRDTPLVPGGTVADFGDRS